MSINEHDFSIELAFVYPVNSAEETRNFSRTFMCLAIGETAVVINNVCLVCILVDS